MNEDEMINKFVDMRTCKQEAMRLLPNGNPIREALSREPDFNPRKEGLTKIETYIRFLMHAHFV